MASTYSEKRLGATATNGTVTTADVLFTSSATADTSTTVSTVVICNRGATAQTFSLATSTTTSFEASGYIADEVTLGPKEFWAFTIGIALDPACRYLLVAGSATTVVASAFGATKVTS
jgi:hypothetical protein